MLSPARALERAMNEGVLEHLPDVGIVEAANHVLA